MVGRARSRPRGPWRLMACRGRPTAMWHSRLACGRRPRRSPSCGQRWTWGCCEQWRLARALALPSLIRPRAPRWAPAVIKKSPREETQEDLSRLRSLRFGSNSPHIARRGIAGIYTTGLLSGERPRSPEKFRKVTSSRAQRRWLIEPPSEIAAPRDACPGSREVPSMRMRSKDAYPSEKMAICEADNGQIRSARLWPVPRLLHASHGESWRRRNARWRE